MASLLRPSASNSCEGSTSALRSNAPESFRDSTFFSVLGRIDEETSLRASMSNATSQDSSPRSLKSSNESESSDWVTPVSPKDLGNDCVEKKDVFSAESRSSSNNANRNISVVNSTTTIEHPTTNVIDSTEMRKERSSPILWKSQSQSMMTNASFSTTIPFSSGITRIQHHHLCHDDETPPPDVEDEQQLKQENIALRRECEELESIIIQMKTEGNVFQARTTLELKNYRVKIESAAVAKETLQTQCRELEDRIWNLRDEMRL